MHPAHLSVYLRLATLDVTLVFAFVWFCGHKLCLFTSGGNKFDSLQPGMFNKLLKLRSIFYSYLVCQSKLFETRRVGG